MKEEIGGPYDKTYMATLLEVRMDGEADKGSPRKQFIGHEAELEAFRVRRISKEQEALRTSEWSSSNH